VSDHAKLALQAGTVFQLYFPADTVPSIKTKLHFMEGGGAWAERYYDRPFDRTAHAELLELLGRLA
jgi:hypothetical protein